MRKIPTWMKKNCCQLRRNFTVSMRSLKRFWEFGWLIKEKAAEGLKCVCGCLYLTSHMCDWQAFQGKCQLSVTPHVRRGYPEEFAHSDSAEHQCLISYKGQCKNTPVGICQARMKLRTQPFIAIAVNIVLEQIHQTHDELYRASMHLKQWKRLQPLKENPLSVCFFFVSNSRTAFFFNQKTAGNCFLVLNFPTGKENVSCMQH